MYRQIENLEKKTAQLQTELDALKERLGERGEPPQGNLSPTGSFAGASGSLAADPEPGFAIKPGEGDAGPSRSLAADRANDKPAAVAAPVGFPWGLVVQILMAILTYLIQRAVTRTERDHLAELKSQLVRETGGTAE